MLAALVENRKRSVAYAGAFLLKDEPEIDSTSASGSETEKSVYDLRGKELFKRLHEVGTLAQVLFLVCWPIHYDNYLLLLLTFMLSCNFSEQITSIQGDQVVLIGHRRLRITDIVRF